MLDFLELHQINFNLQSWLKELRADKKWQEKYEVIHILFIFKNGLFNISNVK